jgi:hypothetical protein
MRNSYHSSDVRLYEITTQGLIVRESLDDYRVVGRGTANVGEGTRRSAYPGLTEEEMVVLQALIELGEAPAEVLARRTGLLEDPNLAVALERLVHLSYASRLDGGAGTTYRAVAQLLG